MRRFFEWLGPRNTVILITVLALIGTLTLTTISYTMAGLALSGLHLWIAAMLALVLAPALGIPVVNQLFKITALEEENRRLATYDSLSGLLSRGALIGRAESYIDLAVRNHSQFALAFIDLDAFKSINDNYGHAVGDELIGAMGKTLLGIKRDSDLAGRYGGDEFIVLLPETNQVGASAFADKMHDAIRGLSIDIPDKKLTPTISIGIGVWRPAKGHKTFTEYLKDSDKALYQAKKAGRNCTVFYDPDEPSNPTSSSITESFSPL